MPEGVTYAAGLLHAGISADTLKSKKRTLKRSSFEHDRTAQYSRRTIGLHNVVCRPDELRKLTWSCESTCIHTPLTKNKNLTQNHQVYQGQTSRKPFTRTTYGNHERRGFHSAIYHPLDSFSHPKVMLKCKRHKATHENYYSHLGQWPTHVQRMWKTPSLNTVITDAQTVKDGEWQQMRLTTKVYVILSRESENRSPMTLHLQQGMFPKPYSTVGYYGRNIHHTISLKADGVCRGRHQRVPCITINRVKRFDRRFQIFLTIM